MKPYRLFSLILLAAVALTAAAQQLADNQILLGYTDSKTYDVGNAGVGQAGTYPMGAILTPSRLASYAGCKVVGLRFAVGQSIGRTRAFIYKVEGNNATPLIEQNQRTYEGWNTVFFNGDGYTITGEESLFYGYDYIESDEMVAAEEGAIACAGSYLNESFYIYSDFGQGLGFYPIQNIGCLCVQLIVDVSNLPRKDADMTYFEVGHRYKSVGKDIDLLVGLSNVGRDSICGYQLGYQIDKMAPVYFNFKDTIAPGQMQMQEIPGLNFTDDFPVGHHTMSFFVASVEGKPLETHRNDTLSSSFLYYLNPLQRQKVYAEVYTDQSSYYVPALNSAFQTYMDHNSNLCMANVFSETSPLVLKKATYLHDLYAYTYPSFTINRAYFPGEEHIAYDMNDLLLALPTDFLVDGILGSIISQDAANPSFATIELKPQYNPESRKLSIDVTGVVSPDAEALYGDLALTLLVGENGVRSRQLTVNTTTGRTMVNQNYTHNHVLRDFITGTQGDKLAVSDLTYTAHYDYTLPQNVNDENVEVVAFITKASDRIADNVNALREMDITNAESFALKPLIDALGVAGVKADRRADASYYTLGGRRLSTSAAQKPGLYIERQPDGTSRKVVVR